MVDTSFLAWSPEMTVGVRALDDEHRQLISEINRLRRAAYAGNRSAIERCLSRLATYAVKHFHNEESYMTKIRYSRLEEHKALHDQFTNAVHSYFVRLNKENHNVIAEEVISFLIDWWTQHILTDDKRYALEADF